MKQLTLVVSIITLICLTLSCATTPAMNEWHSVGSGALDKVKYIAESETLVIGLTDGSVYEYQDVPASAYGRLMAAERKWKYFNRQIRDFYRYTKK